MTVRVIGAVSLLPGFAPVGYLEGTVVEAGNPDAAVQRRVQLFRSNGPHGQIMPSPWIEGWRWSDASGGWRFDKLNPEWRYNVIAYDHTGQYDPVVKMNLVPTVD